MKEVAVELRARTSWRSSATATCAFLLTLSACTHVPPGEGQFIGHRSSFGDRRVVLTVVEGRAELTVSEEVLPGTLTTRLVGRFDALRHVLELKRDRGREEEYSIPCWRMSHGLVLERLPDERLGENRPLHLVRVPARPQPAGR